tara:strand:+ start:107 stop:349 length:243 start_codon:yes stop_codon:yes gene_type:complete
MCGGGGGSPAPAYRPPPPAPKPIVKQAAQAPQLAVKKRQVGAVGGQGPTGIGSPKASVLAGVGGVVDPFLNLGGKTLLGA